VRHGAASLTKTTFQPRVVVTEFVVIKDTAPSEYAGRRAEVVKRKRRRRGPTTTGARYDFWLRFDNGFEGRFSEEEIVVSNQEDRP